MMEEDNHLRQLLMRNREEKNFIASTYRNRVYLSKSKDQVYII